MSSDLVEQLYKWPRCFASPEAAIQKAINRIEALEVALSEATRLMTEASREAGEWKGKYEAAGYPGTLDGWIEKAKSLEEELSIWKSVFPDIAPESVLPDRSKMEAENARLVEAEARAAKAAVQAVIPLEAMNMAGKHRSMSKEMWSEIQNGIAAVRSMIAARARATIGGKDE